MNSQSGSGNGQGNGQGSVQGPVVSAGKALAGEVLAEAAGPDGESLTLRRAGGGFEILSQAQADAGTETAPRLLMASANRRCEGELINFVMGPLRDRNDITVLLAGLGMGYTLAALLQSPRVIRVDVVEHSPAIIEWNRSHLSTLHNEPPLSDSRVHVHAMGLSDYLRNMRYGAIPGLQLENGGYLAVVLDLDHGPSALLRAQNASLYSDDGLHDLEDALRAGGVLALWSAQREPELLARMGSRFQNLAEVAYPVDVPGSTGLDYLYRGRKRGSGNRARAQA
ncbi:MAG: hypothetical protein JNJ46_02930 [Myxococcales bacterium]|nr:hypothetical protein [Myxococcales bacterium]